MNMPPPDEAAHQDGRLMHELTVLNGQISRYVFRFLDADAGQAESMGVEEERALGERLAAAAVALEARAKRHEALGGQSLMIEGSIAPP